jgi:hypothetical protein
LVHISGDPTCSDISAQLGFVCAPAHFPTQAKQGKLGNLSRLHCEMRELNKLAHLKLTV